MQHTWLKIFGAIAAIAVMVGTVVLLSDREPTQEMLSGTIADISGDNREVTIWHNGSSTALTVNDQTVIETKTQRVTPDYLRPGFPVETSLITRDTTMPTARWITITSEPDVLVEEPLPNQRISSPFSISGEARGTWFFEASFPVQLKDQSGSVIAEGAAEAEDDWMQEGYVPFTADLDFSNAKNVGESGTLVLQKANPSGLAENADSREIPVSFAGTMQVEVFFGKDIVGTDIIKCDEVFSATREIPQTSAPARAALNELLSGPTEQEIEERYITNIPDRVEIQSLEIRNGTAYVDFNQALQQNVGGSCRVQAIRSQIEMTLKQFSSVDAVEISIDGETETVLQP